MNIFILDKNTKKSAQYHCDTHVVKMILESAQMLCTVNSILGEEVPYKPTHQNHPCTKWVLESKSNWLWLKDLAKHLNNEYKYRFNHTENHKSWDVIKNLKPPKNLEDIGYTKPAKAMDDIYKVKGTVNSYRNYYRLAKADLLKYTKRKAPEWLNKN